MAYQLDHEIFWDYIIIEVWVQKLCVIFLCAVEPVCIEDHLLPVLWEALQI